MSCRVVIIYLLSRVSLSFASLSFLAHRTLTRRQRRLTRSGYSRVNAAARERHFQSFLLKGPRSPRGGGYIYGFRHRRAGKKGGLLRVSLSRGSHIGRTEKEKIPERRRGGMFSLYLRYLADSSLTQSSRGLTPVKIFVTAVLEPLRRSLRSLLLCPAGDREKKVAERLGEISRSFFFYAPPEFLLRIEI